MRVRDLRKLEPDIEIAWLAVAPARERIAEAGETGLPGCRDFDETVHAEQLAHG